MAAENSPSSCMYASPPAHPPAPVSHVHIPHREGQPGRQHPLKSTGKSPLENTHSRPQAGGKLSRHPKNPSPHQKGQGLVEGDTGSSLTRLPECPHPLGLCLEAWGCRMPLGPPPPEPQTALFSRFFAGFAANCQQRPMPPPLAACARARMPQATAPCWKKLPVSLSTNLCPAP